MPTAHVELSQEEAESLTRIAEKTGKTEEIIIKEAVQRLLSEAAPEDWRENIRQAAGIWKDRDDLPSLDEMRKESDRIHRFFKDE